MSDLGHLLMEESDTLVDVSVYYMIKQTQSGSSKVVVLDDEKGKEMMDSEEQTETVHILNTKWKNARWVEQNDIMKQSQRINMDTGIPELDWTAYRDLRIKKLLVDWDMEYNGEKVPVKPELIDKLPAQLVLSLFDKYERSTTIDSDEQKK